MTIEIPRLDKQLAQEMRDAGNMVRIRASAHTGPTEVYWARVSGNLLLLADAIEAGDIVLFDHPQQTEVLTSCERLRYRISMGHLLPMTGEPCRLCGVPSYAPAISRERLREQITSDPDSPSEAGASEEP